MSSRLKPLVIAAMLLAVVGMLYDLSTRPRSQVTGPNYARLEPGMTKDEVRAILGEPDAENEVTRGMDWWTWYDPRSLDNSITAIFVTPPGTLKSKERLGELPERPRLFPPERVKPPIPPFVKQTLTLNQDRERRKTLMAAPSSKTVDPLFLP